MIRNMFENWIRLAKIYRRQFRSVGAGGSVIKELQEEFSVKINIDREPDDDGNKSVEVTGSADDVKSAVDAINQKIGGGRAPRKERSAFDDDEGDKSKQTIMMPSGLIGRPVGEAGATIQEYSSENNVNINIDRDGNEHQHQRWINSNLIAVARSLLAIRNAPDVGSLVPSGTFGVVVGSSSAVLFGAEIPAGINFDNFDKIQVVVSGEGADLIKHKDAELREILLKNVQKSGYTKPTPIQKYAIPIIQSKRDLMGCAQSGSGKTAAFILPILDSIMTAEESLSIGQPQALIVAPTRELAIQIFDEARKFANSSWVKICIANGGAPSQRQRANISRGCHLLVATPGRLMDYVGKGLVTFESLRFLVLDEADRMLNMGFHEYIRDITTHTTLQKDKVQTLMFSATFPEEIQRLAATYLRRNYLFLTVGIVGGASTDVDQEFIEVGKFKKRGKLMEILGPYCNNPREEDRILVFVEMKRKADFLASFVSEVKVPSMSMHSGHSQREREGALTNNNLRKRMKFDHHTALIGDDYKNAKKTIEYLKKIGLLYKI